MTRSRAPVGTGHDEERDHARCIPRSRESFSIAIEIELEQREARPRGVELPVLGHNVQVTAWLTPCRAYVDERRALLRACIAGERENQRGDITLCRTRKAHQRALRQRGRRRTSDERREQ